MFQTAWAKVVSLLQAAFADALRTWISSLILAAITYVTTSVVTADWAWALKLLGPTWRVIAEDVTLSRGIAALGPIAGALTVVLVRRASERSAERARRVDVLDRVAWKSRWRKHLGPSLLAPFCEKCDVQLTEIEITKTDDDPWVSRRYRHPPQRSVRLSCPECRRTIDFPCESMRLLRSEATRRIDAIVRREQRAKDGVTPPATSPTGPLN